MSTYITSKKDMKFQSIESLQPVENVIAEADSALNDKSKRISDSPIQEALTGAIRTGIGAGIGFASLYLGGTVTGLSATGITSGLTVASSLIG